MDKRRSKHDQARYHSLEYSSNRYLDSDQVGSKPSSSSSSFDGHKYTEQDRIKHYSSRYKETSKSSSSRKYSGSKDSSKSSESKGSIEFSFEQYRYELGRVLLHESNLVIDDDDFWKFLKKYETVQKQRQMPTDNSNSSSVNENSSLGLPSTFDKTHLVPFSLTLDSDDLYVRLPPQDSSQRLSRKHVQQFRDIVILYLDFKQRENFAKLQKLRKSQCDLPVAQYRNAIIEAVKKEQVVIVAGDTGCGKSTQIPQYLLKAGYNSIACTQPRRIACISLCKRVAFETLNEFSTEIGYQIRFERSKTQRTKIVFITEGLLLRQLSTDSTLSSYDVLVLDEVHERHLHGDFLLGIVKCLLYKRQDLKIVLMSATINIKLFQDYFSEEAVVIQVPGRLYPIKMNYCPVSIEDRSSKSERLNPAPYLRILQLIDKKYPKDEKGDVLIFLSGMSEISTVVDAAKAYSEQTQGWIVLPLHSTLSIADQDKVFDYPPEGVRKCIVSTNIAETSITIDGVRFVVDSGKVKEMSYDPLCKMQKLKEFWISRASAEQRKGRAGRTGPGVCYRLFSEVEYEAMSRYSTPEIQRVPLDSLLLQMVALGLPDARKFPFIEPPPAESIENSIRSLKQQGALTENEKLTSVGRTLSHLPVDISLGKMLIMGSLFHQVEPVLSLAAALSVQNPFTNRAYRDPECETSLKHLESDHGDPLTLLNAFREWLEVKSNSSGGRDKLSRNWCRRRGLEEQRFYEMTKLRKQFKDLLQDAGLLRSNINAKELSSSERALRHGELKVLHSLKRTIKEAGPRKKKQLKLDVWEIGEEGNEGPGDIDIRDVEFRLSNDSSQVQELLTGATACSYKDLMMLKVILTSGLYPQMAIADEFNYCKSVSEQLFHTQGKPYVALHPMSFFGNHPQVLQLEESDIVDSQGPGSHSKLPLSSKHQLLCYMSLLETTKPYLVTTMRMPAAQTLLLFAQHIDTDEDFSKLVCDSWLQLDFPVGETAGNLLVKAASLRNKWEQLLSTRLEDAVEGAPAPHKSAAQLEHELSVELPQFMHTEVCYSLTRLLAADIKILYVGPSLEVICMDPNPFHETWQCHPHDVKGGVQLAPYITYNCLFPSNSASITSYMEEPWHCPSCDLTACLNVLERLQHSLVCKASTSSGEAVIDSKEPRKLNSREFVCDHCNKTLFLTPTEILRHKKQHT